MQNEIITIIGRRVGVDLRGLDAHRVGANEVAASGEFGHALGNQCQPMDYDTLNE